MVEDMHVLYSESGNYFVIFFAFLTQTLLEPKIYVLYRSVSGVCTLSSQLLLQFLADPFETLQVLNDGLNIRMYFFRVLKLLFFCMLN